MLTKFEILVKLTALRLGKESVVSQKVDKFKGRTKLLTLLASRGNDGIDTLKSLVFNLKSVEKDNHEKSLTLLNEYYGKSESLYILTMRFVTASQVAGEDEREYLLRVESLSRNMDFGEHEYL